MLYCKMHQYVPYYEYAQCIKQYGGIFVHYFFSLRTAYNMMASSIKRNMVVSSVALFLTQSLSRGATALRPWDAV